MSRLDWVKDSTKLVWNVCIKFDTRKKYWKLSIIEEKNVAINGNQCWEKTMLIEKVRSYSSQFSYTDVMMNMKLLSVVTPPSIYHGWSNRKTFWEEKFTLGEFTSVNMKNYGRWNVRKHRDIKDSDEYITLDI